MLQIEKGIPLPERKFFGEPAYPYNQMEVGDSFMLPHEDSNKAVARLSSTAAAYGKRAQMKFSVRKVEGGARVWRVA